MAIFGRDFNQITSFLIPIHKNNHWMALVLHRDADTICLALFADSFGNRMSFCFPEFNGLLVGSNIPVLHSRIQQQRNEHDYGPFTVINL